MWARRHGRSVLVVSLPYEGYSPVSQNVSELLAVGAPTRPLMVVLRASTLADAGDVAAGSRKTGDQPNRDRVSYIHEHGWQPRQLASIVDRTEPWLVAVAYH
jgi:hypothetical protein